MLAAQHRRKEERIQYKATGLKSSRLDNSGQKIRRKILPPLAKAAIDLDLIFAKTHHKATIGLPARVDIFKLKYGPHRLDVRKAAFQFHLATGNRKPREFANIMFPPDHPTHPSEFPVPNLFNTTTGTKTIVKEFPVGQSGPGYLGSGIEKGVARILLSNDLRFEGVIAHNPTLPRGSLQWDDHYLAAHRMIGLHEYYTAHTLISLI